MMSDVCCSHLTACNSEIHNGRMLYVKLYVCIKIQKVLRAHKHTCDISKPMIMKKYTNPNVECFCSNIRQTYLIFFSGVCGVL